MLPTLPAAEATESDLILSWAPGHVTPCTRFSAGRRDTKR